MRHGSNPLRQNRERSIAPSQVPVGPRHTYYHLANADEYPEVLPLALRLVRDGLESFINSPQQLPADLGRYRDDPSEMPRALAALSELAALTSNPWNHREPAVARRQVMHYLTQYLPAALVDGCWLQGAVRVATAHTEVGAGLTAAYAHQVHAYAEDPDDHFVSEYRHLYRLLATPVEDVSARSFSVRREFLDSSFELPALLLSIGQFPRMFQSEIVGLHLAWQFLEVPSFSRSLVRDARMHHSLPAANHTVTESTDAQRGRLLALEVARRLLQGNAKDVNETWRCMWSGLALAANAWTAWLTATGETVPDGPPDPRQEMIDLLCRKAPHAGGYHGNKRLGGTLLDDQFRAVKFDPEALLDNLASSRLVTPGDPESSGFLQRLVVFGGPMVEVFSPAEIMTIKNWISRLPPRSQAAHQRASLRIENESDPTRVPEPVRPLSSSATFRKRSERRYANCSVRELYHYLVNLEFFPDVLPVAERFASDRLERSMLTVKTGDRPIPSERYDPDALERWVHVKHREQVDSYRPLIGAPRISRREFIESTVQLAPLILIDGGWLQGIASPALIHRTVGCMLFHVFYEEAGEGNPAQHHANIYRDLLTAMGEAAPPVDTKEFVNWPRLRDASFDVPTLWLSISSFPRHFLPEILGLNLAVELAGIGGPYLEARDTLRHFGLPTLFVDVHNAADNVSVGHSAWALKAINAYMDEVAAREGPHNVDYHWHRVWSGVRATLPQVSFIRLALHRIAARVLGSPQERRVPRIFRT
jgi:hypothetical protein